MSFVQGPICPPPPPAPKEPRESQSAPTSQATLWRPKGVGKGRQEKGPAVRGCHPGLRAWGVRTARCPCTALEKPPLPPRLGGSGLGLSLWASTREPGEEASAPASGLVFPDSKVTPYWGRPPAPASNFAHWRKCVKNVRPRPQPRGTSRRRPLTEGKQQKKEFGLRDTCRRPAGRT